MDYFKSMMDEHTDGDIDAEQRIADWKARALAGKPRHLVDLADGRSLLTYYTGKLSDTGTPEQAQRMLTHPSERADLLRDYPGSVSTTPYDHFWEPDDHLRRSIVDGILSI